MARGPAAQRGSAPPQLGHALPVLAASPSRRNRTKASPGHEGIVSCAWPPWMAFALEYTFQRLNAPREQGQGLVQIAVILRNPAFSRQPSARLMWNRLSLGATNHALKKVRSFLKIGPPLLPLGRCMNRAYLTVYRSWPNHSGSRVQRIGFGKPLANLPSLLAGFFG